MHKEKKIYGSGDWVNPNNRTQTRSFTAPGDRTWVYHKTQTRSKADNNNKYTWHWLCALVNSEHARRGEENIQALTTLFDFHQRALGDAVSDLQ